jgi:DNA-binding MarR family transcriptional regulator
MTDLETIFGKTAQLEVLRNLISKKDEITYLSGIAEETGLSHASVARVIVPLIREGIVKESMLGKQVRIFQLDTTNPLTREIIEFAERVEAI